MTRRLEDLLIGLNVTHRSGDMNARVAGITYDSRKVEPGFLFVAVRGAKQEGIGYVRDALGRGAAGVVADRPVPEVEDCAVVQVEDSRQALSRLAANFYDHPARELCLIGITGTNGKTTTSLLIESMLRASGLSVGVLGTLAYRWGNVVRKAPMTTPESLDLQALFRAMRQDGVTHVVMEVSSHALSMGRVEGCEFDAGVFTNLSQDHLDFHGTMEEYFASKLRLFQNHLKHRADGVAPAVVNGDDPYGMRLIELLGAATWSYAIDNSAARVRVTRADLLETGIKADLSCPTARVTVDSPLIGRLNLYNLLAAASTGLAIGLDSGTISKGVSAVTSVDGRLQRVPIPRGLGYSVVVDYAHTPDAMDKALGCLREMTRKRLIAVFGCGGDRDRGKRPLMGATACRWADLVVLTSDNPRSEVPEAIIADIEEGVRASGWNRLDAAPRGESRQGYMVTVDRRSAIELALDCARPGDVVFIGGKGHETYQIVGSQVLAFDDRSVVQEYVASKGL